MTSKLDNTFTRRTFVKGTGSLVVGFSLAGVIATEAAAKAAKASGGTVTSWPLLNVNQVDSFLEIKSDGSVIATFGKGTASQGTIMGVLQMYADELDVPLSSITPIIGDTALTPDQVGASGSNGTSSEWVTVRQAAATARQQLLTLASAKLGVPVANLTVKDGVVSGTGASQTVTYGQLIGGQKFNLTISPTAPQKTPAQFKVMGSSPARTEIPKIVTGNYDYVHDVRLPGMLHARNIKPPVAGATLVSVDGPHNLPGLVKVVAKGNYLAVVAKKEWQAVQASHALKVTWKPPATPPLPNGYDEFYNYLVTGPVVNSSVTKVGDADAALKSAAKVVSATYQVDFQSHSTLGPFCALANFQNGSCVVHMGGQKPYGQQRAISDMLSTLINPAITVNNVRIIWHPGASSYGRSEADDVSIEAAYLSAVVGAPVRMQWMRHESTGWDPKGMPALVTAQAGLDASNKVVAWKWNGYSVYKQLPGAEKLGDTLMGQLMGYQPSAWQTAFPSNSGYGYPNVLVNSYNVDWTRAIGTSLRHSHLRSPSGPQTAFASEQFEDEIAAAVGLDPIAFRLTYLSSPRAIRALQVVAKSSGWASRPGPSPASSSKARVVSGRGVAIGGNIATVAAVEVDRHTGNVRVTQATTAHDSGFVVNPGNITTAVKAASMHAINRAISEGVTFDSSGVTSVDWDSYPILNIADTPKMNLVLVGQDGLDPNGNFVAPSGAGEPVQAPVVAAIANAVFDATGVRVRRMPMTPEVVLAALKAAGKAL